MTGITHAYVGLGSNLGDRAGHLLLAVRGMLDAGLVVSRLSSIYETEPVGTPTAQPLYLNMVAELALCARDDDDAAAAPPPPSPEQLLARLLRIEYLLGRRRDAALAPRTIDLDLLLYGDAHAATAYLTLPHPRLHLRRFVLVPLCELAPELAHPKLRRTFAELLDAAPGDAGVRLWQAK
ncbi:MAG TPA: 2-amino-4-hydroxy-6-hydroxymethyldihydropteridine diphosphokinase [Pyrinomonadaceae bacterium]|nr:2-amino-4-hydroxy-6-hydroxymethyldihydropteridine diphosphokinase [Pyrinomonadaceae bacterium]